MSWWTLEPRDPLMVRDGRPFGADDDNARSLAFPPPSVIAGALRTRVGFAGRAPGQSAFGMSAEDARAIQTIGPLLAEVGRQDQLVLLPAAPQDCVLFPADGGWRRFRLAPDVAPARSPDVTWPTDLSSLATGLLPVIPVTKLPLDKPARDAPAFWTEAQLQQWLQAPPDEGDLPAADTAPALPHERRIHLKLDPATGTGEDGMLFSTDGLRFSTGGQGPADAVHHRRVMVVHCADPRLKSGLVPVGGERRISILAPLAGDSPAWSAPDLQTQRARVVLLTPALFDAGAVPRTLAGARVCAAAVGRPQVVSGWDMAANSGRGGPKPTRRLAPAGSVYWVELGPNQDMQEWIDQVHWQTISDNEQDRRDGFGLAAVGVWT